MKRFFFIPVIFLSFLLSGCIEGVEYITKPYGNFENGGTKVTESKYFKDGKKTSDWLFIHYMAADNSLDYALYGFPLFTDLNEIESGMFTIRNDDGSSKTNCASVNYVVLFDGAMGINNHSATHIYDIGPDNDSTVLGKNTIDITDVSFLEKSGYEANMTDCRTLTNFLNWVNNHYEADCVVFVLGSHGGGPGGASTYLNASRSTRIICPDDTNANGKFMSSEEFAHAFKDAGYGLSNKLDLMVLDICLGASFEDAFELKDISNYSIVSPNSTPGTGHNYSLLLELLNNKKNNITTAKDLGIGICNNFFNSYHKLSSMNGIPFYPTITMLDLSKVDSCGNHINGLAGMIKDNANSYAAYLRPSTEAGCYYVGSYNYLFDAGDFAIKICDKTSEQHIKSKINVDLLPALNEMIVFSWRRLNDKVDINQNNAYGNTDSSHGLTLCGAGVNGSKIKSWYKSDLAFGKQSDGWADMIMNWFGTDSGN